MKKGMISLSVLCAGFLMISCGTGRNSLSSVSLDGEWNIIEVDGTALNAAESALPTIGFDGANHRIYGNSGCNRMMGTYETHSSKPGSLHFGPLGSTRMACPDMTVENRILGALKKVAAYKTVNGTKSTNLSEGTLALCDAKGNQLLLIQRAPLDISSLNGEWRIVEIAGKAVGKTESEPFIGFDISESRIYGNAGCNNINGGFEQIKDQPFSLLPGQVVSTMMACPDLTTEDAVLAALNQVKSFRFLGKEKAELLGASGKPLLSLVRK